MTILNIDHSGIHLDGNSIFPKMPYPDLVSLLGEPDHSRSSFTFRDGLATVFQAAWRNGLATYIYGMGDEPIPVMEVDTGSIVIHLQQEERSGDTIEAWPFSGSLTILGCQFEASPSRRMLRQSVAMTLVSHFSGEGATFIEYQSGNISEAKICSADRVMQILSDCGIAEYTFYSFVMKWKGHLVPIVAGRDGFEVFILPELSLSIGVDNATSPTVAGSQYLSHISLLDQSCPDGKSAMEPTGIRAFRTALAAMNAATPALKDGTASHTGDRNQSMIGEVATGANRWFGEALAKTATKTIGVILGLLLLVVVLAVIAFVLLT